jgi:hypothetical protein
MLLFRLPEPHSGSHPVGIRRSNLQPGLALLPEPQLLATSTKSWHPLARNRQTAIKSQPTCSRRTRFGIQHVEESQTSRKAIKCKCETQRTRAQ